jgi:putative hydrolase of HD superfamily
MTADNTKFIHLFLQLGKMKTTKRAGWILHSVPGETESIADHSYRVSMMTAMLAPSLKINQQKAIMMSLLHDAAESITGDIITQRGTKVLPNQKEKADNERAAFIDLFRDIDSGYLDLYDELIQNQTPEARFVNQLDKLETAIQAKEYEIKHRIDLSEFYENTKSRLDDKVLIKLLGLIQNTKR